VAALLERVRSASDDFALPSWACNSYRTLFSELEQLERDLHTHVHLENHVLKPRFAG
jgi:regulator of cell morphogenesis and NO signaling